MPHRKVQYLFNNKKNDFIKYNPIFLIVGGIMFSYQKIISPQISASCYYYPSCSEFSIQLIQEYGLFKGILLTTDRISRCNKIAIQDVPTFRFDNKLNKIKESVKIYQENK